jgi:hypothetical protein
VSYVTRAACGCAIQIGHVLFCNERGAMIAVAIMGIVFGILGIFTIGVVFVPLAALCAVVALIGGGLCGGSPQRASWRSWRAFWPASAQVGPIARLDG